MCKNIKVILKIAAEIKKGLSLLEEEKLTEYVREYAILYDKNHKGHMEKDAVSNASNDLSLNIKISLTKKFLFLSASISLSLCFLFLLRK